MKDFSKWAELSTQNGTDLWPVLTCCMVGLIVAGVFCFCLMRLSNEYDELFEFSFPFLLVGAMLGAVLCFTEAENKASNTASFTVQVEKEFDVRNLSCPPAVMSTKDALPDAGTYRCTVSDGRDDSALKDVTLIVTADNKVGLYDNQGKALK